MIPPWVRAALWVVVLALAAAFAFKIRGTLAIFSLAFLIAYLLNPLVRAMESGRLRFLPRIPRIGAILLVYLTLLGVMGAALSLMVPVATEQASNIAQQLPDQIGSLQQGLEGLWNQYLRRVPPDVRAKVEAAAANLAEQAASGLGVAFEKLRSFVAGFFSGVFLVLTAMLIAIYILLNWESMGPGLLEITPMAYQDDAIALSRKMHEIFGGYLKAIIVTSLACGGATFVVLVVISAAFARDFPYTLILSLVAGIIYGIPIVGILVSAALGALLAFVSSGSWGFALAVTTGMLLANTLIDRTLFPKLSGEAMGVSPLFVLFGAFAGGEFLGIWGMLLGIPLSAMARALFTWFHDRFLVAPQVVKAPLAAVLPSVSLTLPPARVAEPPPPPPPPEGGEARREVGETLR